MGARCARLAGFDWECSQGGVRVLAGVDEAGRGCWAGPVVAAAVILPPRAQLVGLDDLGLHDLDDSKRLSAAKREAIFAAIRACAVSWTACAVSAAEIDRLNILAASLEAMGRAANRLRPAPELLLVDGLQVPRVACEARAVVKGDGTSAAIAAASVVAKVLRDRIMVVLARRYPGYGFAGHKGYGAPEHRAALAQLGPCPQHRCSYQPVAAWQQLSLWHEPR
jgi:ribonuclease HII